MTSLRFSSQNLSFLKNKLYFKNYSIFYQYVKIENIYSINSKIPEMPLEQYLCVNTYFPRLNILPTGAYQKNLM